MKGGGRGRKRNKIRKTKRIETHKQEKQHNTTTLSLNNYINNN